MKALPGIDREREPALTLAAEHNLLLALVDLDRAGEAWHRLWLVRSLYEEVGTPFEQVMLLWLEGRIAAAQGRPIQAEQFLRDTKAGCERLGLRYSAAIVSLDLAAVLLEQNRPFEVPALLERALATFQGLGIEREELMALALLYQTARRGAATAVAVREIARKLRYREVWEPRKRP